MLKIRNSYAFFVTVVFTLTSPLLTAQEASNSIQSLSIPYSKNTAIIDGELNDPIWDEANTVELNIVNYPWNNVSSPVKTTAKIVENGEFLYVSFVAQDPNPENIQASLGDRDTKWGDDLVVVKLDTFNTRRLNYQFMVNPFGVQIDEINNEMTGEANSSWDAIWQSYGKITEQGYQVELAIPYRILNFSDNDEIKTWAIELIRLYPRDTRLRISHIPLDRDNDCWLCQIPEAKGFKNAKAGKKLMLTPALVAQKDQYRDVYDSSNDWHSDSDIEAGLDLRWGINSNTLLNATINPDFSTVESDAGQLSINKTFSLYYEEKRQFFTENSDYFSSNYNLVYSRNIADPDYGAKLTGSKDKHSYGVFITNDTETNFIIPGNTQSRIASLNTESHSGAIKYRFDANEDLSIGAISTLRTADNYHNYVFGFDGKYKFDDSNSILAQWLSSDTKHEGNFQDQALKLNFIHSSEYWGIKAEHQDIGQDFRADLGYMPYADYQLDSILVDRFFYGESDSIWQEAKLSGQWQIKHSDKGELLEKSLATSFGIDGPLLSYVDIMLTHAEKVGLRYDPSKTAIDGNTTLFTENQAVFHLDIQPSNKLYSSVDITLGDKIDYDNNRLGDYKEISANIAYNATKHLEIDFYQTYGSLEADSANVYRASLSELRLSYQFDVRSYLKLNLVYSDIERNPNNNPMVDVSATNNDLSAQLIYAYKINPQTVFFLGYSDFSYQDDDLFSLERAERTFFTKVSYAWLP
ncbi:carbohydrate binding family 9 domain-containing protein [Thalassotalea piscium]|uniref:Carbohydrate binding family 9 domain-containing protein n=1 Tax=Thalassotalea piscium TaxID=1230533 RepID=A0A7X0NFD6_9GAMM|nr:carbohydrate binding family 9 domain-containing protein [Thalassotalea piscium]MBB6542463.1 hypothetical protein [Thalassotalea piscium]